MQFKQAVRTSRGLIVEVTMPKNINRLLGLSKDTSILKIKNLMQVKTELFLLYRNLLLWRDQLHPKKINLLQDS
jgi:hypothetical protein